MILHRLLLEDFRGVTREEVMVPRRGVLVIEGPNESGKTSLLDALEMLLEHKASSGRADVKAASPVGRDVPVVVEAEFTVDGQRMVYRKEFVRGKRTSLEFPDSARQALTGDDAHDHVRDLLDRKVDRSLWRALRIAQDEPIGQVDAAKGMDSLRRALDAAAGGEDPTGDDSLISRVAEERNRYLTARKGDPTGDLARSDARVLDARAALSAARAAHAELDAAVEDHAGQVAVHRARREALASVEAEVVRLEAAGAIVVEQRHACAEADSEVDRAAAEHDAASRGARERTALVEEVERDRSRAERLRDEVEEIAERLAPAEDRAERARIALEAAEADLTGARARLDAVRAAKENEHRRTELDRVDHLVATLTSVGDELAAVQARLVEVEVDEAAVEQIRSADDTLREAEVRSVASAPTVEVSGSGEVDLAGETREADPGWSLRIVEDTTFEVGSVALKVVPAGDTDAVRREVFAARERLEALLTELGVDSRAAAEERLKLTTELRAEIASLRRRRTDLLVGDTFEDLVTRRDALRDQLRDSGPVDAARDVGGDAVGGDWDEGDPVAAAAAAEQLLSVRRAEDRTAATEVASMRTAHATRQALSEDAASRSAASADVLARAREAVADDALAEGEERARAKVEQAREAARRARADLDAVLADAPPELLENVRASQAALREEEREAANGVATALGRVNVIGDQGRLGEVSAADRELREAQRENDALWRRARAADLLHRTLTTRRSEAMRAYQEPFHRAVVELGSLVYGRDFDVRLGDDLTIEARRLGDVTVDYDALSGGAREQLAVIVRIACARLVGEAGVPVFLDDTMGYTDPTRRLTMGAVIAAASSTSQVVVLTCDRARFAGIGGARTHVMRRSSVSGD